MTGRGAGGRARGANRIALAGALALAAAIAACDDGPSNVAAVDFPATLMPLAVGTRWTYDVVDSVIQSADPHTTTSRTGLSFGVTGDTTDENGVVWAVLDSSSGAVIGESAGVHNYLTNAPGGVFGWLALPPQFPVVSLYLPYPPGGSSGPGFVRTFVTVVYTRVATDSVITVPAGTFHCLVYVSAPGNAVFATPGVGVVLRTLPPVTTTDASGALVLQRQVQYRLRAADTIGVVSFRRAR